MGNTENIKKAIEVLRKDIKEPWHIPKCRTPRTISEYSEIPLEFIMSAIFYCRVLPMALADETPVFDKEAESEIIKTAKKFEDKRRRFQSEFDKAMNSNHTSTDTTQESQ